jgi:signal transduction histidine kinase/CheY-like chemotaxis protein
MGPRAISEKDTRRLRVLKLASWIACLVTAVLGAVASTNASPTWKTHAVAVLVYALTPLLGRRAPLLAAVTILVCAYTQIFITTILVGTGVGTSMLYLTLAGVAFAFLGTERILLVTFFGLLAVVLVVMLEALVPYNAGVHSSTRLFFASFVPITAATTIVFMATVYYALRTAERAEEALARDNEIVQDKTRQLEIANKYKSHLIASASHDLRQPLHALNLFVARLHDEADPAERSRLVACIDACVDSMNELFESLLDMTKLDAGVIEPSAAALSVKRLLARIETTFGEVARRKGLRLRIVASGAWVSSDPILLERILLNLVSNAVRYTERGGVVVGCRRCGDTLRIDVCDTGIGIPEDQRRSIFGEFYQLEHPGIGRRQGLGLGLAIVDRLCRLLGHQVEVSSQPGRGSRFSVSVPLAAQPRMQTEMVAPASPVADPARGKRVLVIDDDMLVLDGMRGILQRWGCQVETAVSGAAAIASLLENGERPDLIISDSRLSDGQSGIDAIDRLRAALGARIPAFIITGDTAPERLREASAGGFLLLHKPVSPMALRTTLNRLLKVSAPSSRSDAAA